MGTGISMAIINQIKQYAQDHAYDKALDLIRQQDLSKSYNSQFVRICGEVFLYTHNYEECRNALLMAHKMAPEGIRILFDMVQLYLETGEPDLAEKYYEQYVFYAPKDDSGLNRLQYMLERSRHASAGKLYETLSPLYTHDRSDALSYEFMLIFMLMGDTSKFNEEYSYLFDNFKDSEYKSKAKHLMEHKNAADELYTYPETSVLTHDEKIDADESLLLEQDYYRMYPKEPEIVLMADDYDAQAESYAFKLTMDKWAEKRRQKAEKRAAAKAEKKQIKENDKKQDVSETNEAAPEETVTEAQPVFEPEETVTEAQPVPEPEETVTEAQPVFEPEETVTEEEPVFEPEETVTEEEPVFEPEEMVTEEEPVFEPEETVTEEESISESEYTPDSVSAPDNMTEIFIEDDMVEFFDGAPGQTDINSVVQEIYTDETYADTEEAEEFDTETEYEPENQGTAADKHQQIFDEYDEMLKKEEARLAEQFEREARLLQEAQSILDTVESGVDHWNKQKVNHLFEAFDMNLETAREDMQEQPPDLHVDFHIDEDTKTPPKENPVFEAAFEDIGIPAADDKEETLPPKKDVQESMAKKPHIELREHTKSMLTLDVRKKDILQQLKVRKER